MKPGRTPDDGGHYVLEARRARIDGQSFEDAAELLLLVTRAMGRVATQWTGFDYENRLLSIEAPDACFKVLAAGLDVAPSHRLVARFVLPLRSERPGCRLRVRLVVPREKDARVDPEVVGEDGFTASLVVPTSAVEFAILREVMLGLATVMRADDARIRLGTDRGALVCGRLTYLGSTHQYDLEPTKALDVTVLGKARVVQAGPPDASIELVEALEAQLLVHARAGRAPRVATIYDRFRRLEERLSALRRGDARAESAMAAAPVVARVDVPTFLRRDVVATPPRATPAIVGPKEEHGDSAFWGASEVAPVGVPEVAVPPLSVSPTPTPKRRAVVVETEILDTPPANPTLPFGSEPTKGLLSKSADEKRPSERRTLENETVALPAHPTGAGPIRSAGPGPVGLPTLTLVQYASLLAELELGQHPEEEILKKYGVVSNAAKAALDAEFAPRVSSMHGGRASFDALVRQAMTQLRKR